jgi:hypothetical protein
MNPVRLAVAVLRADSRSRVSAVFVAIGVAFGVALVLWLIAAPDALQARADREAWRGNNGHSVNVDDPRAAVIVVANRDDVGGRLVERYDVAALKPGVRVAPGIPKLPGPGEVLLSPALANLTSQFPGKVVGTIGPEALEYPDELVVLIGHEPSALHGFARPDLVGTPGADAREGVLYLLTRIGLVVLVVPCLVLVASAARLTAARRERRLAALRLAGATPRQVVVMTAAETAIAAVVGSVVGVLGSIPLRHLTARIPWDGGTWLPSDFVASPFTIGVVAVLAPVMVVGAAVLGLRRVVQQPLGAAQQESRRGPSPFRLLLIVGAGAVFVVGLGMADSGYTTVLIGLAAVAFALVLAGPLVTAVVGRMFTSGWRKPSTLLAGRRLTDDPKAAFRSAAGVVLAVFTASMAMVMFPALEDKIEYSDATWRDDVLVAQSIGGGEEQVAALHAELDRRGVFKAVVPVVEGYAVFSAFPDLPGAEVVIAPCAEAMKVLTGLQAGTCEAGPAAYVPEWMGDRLRGGAKFRPNGVDRDEEAIPANLPIRQYAPSSGRPLIVIDPALLPKLVAGPNSAAVLTDPTNRAAAQVAMIGTLPGASVVSNRRIDLAGAALEEDLWRATVIGLAIATAIGAVSSAVGAAGSVVDRRRTFAALVAAGTPVRVLTRALRAEVVLPVLVATFGACAAGAAVGVGLANLARGRLIVVSPWLGAPIALGLVVALVAAASCGPVLRRVTAQSYADE